MHVGAQQLGISMRALLERKPGRHGLCRREQRTEYGHRPFRRSRLFTIPDDDVRRQVKRNGCISRNGAEAHAGVRLGENEPRNGDIQQHGDGQKVFRQHAALRPLAVAVKAQRDQGDGERERDQQVDLLCRE